MSSNGCSKWTFSHGSLYSFIPPAALADIIGTFDFRVAVQAVILSPKLTDYECRDAQMASLDPKTYCSCFDMGADVLATMTLEAGGTVCVTAEFRGHGVVLNKWSNPW